MDKKKTSGAAAAIVAALLYGGSELMDMQSRLDALEEIHPELVTGEPMDEEVEEVEEKSGSEASQSEEPAE
tara:strand:- start:331 stop:543 length:213 start_codon:yes stop_codon:yes gene_type:complete